MKIFASILATTILFSACFAEDLPRKCLVANPEKEDCGYPGIRPDNCLALGCCYDSRVARGTPWCYKASKNRFLDMTTLALMAQQGVSFDVIASLYADAYESAEWLFAFSGGKLDTGRLLSQIAGANGYTFSPMLTQVLAGKDPVDILLSQMGSSSGYSPTLLKYMIDGNTQVVLKHLLSILSAQNKNPGIPYHILSAAASGQGINSNALIQWYASQILPAGDRYTNEFYKKLLEGKTSDAIKWAYLVALKDKFPQGDLYPKNAAIFVSLVKTQKTYPGKISPKILLALAKGEHIPALSQTPATFKQMFGVDAKDYVCASHSPNIQIQCAALKGRYYVTQRECLDAGCCVQEATQPGDSTICFENVLGSIGVLLGQSIIDEDYIVNTVLGGELIDIDNFIPWVPNNEYPEAFTNFVGSGSTNIFAHHFPTYMPIAASRRRPNFVWKPHAPTPLPFPTKFAGYLVPTEEPGKVEGEKSEEAEAEEPLVGTLTLNRFGSSCRAVRNKDRYACVSNSVAFGAGGQAQCLSSDCCYDPIWSNLSVPACFRVVTYGQCYQVPYEEREDCGTQGINKTECEKNPQCCYDSAIPYVNAFDSIPWCYYKKRAPIREDNRCSRSVAYKDRQGCFPSYTLNFAVSRKTCESVEGCCYDRIKVSYFDIAIGKSVQPPYCYKGKTFDINPTEEKTPGGEVEAVCESSEDLPPYSRIDCGPKNWFQCVSEGCCYDAVPNIPGAPFCYQKTEKALSS